MDKTGRKQVQGLRYCNLELRESRYVAAYLNLLDDFAQIERNAVTTAGDIDFDRGKNHLTSVESSIDDCMNLVSGAMDSAFGDAGISSLEREDFYEMLQRTRVMGTLSEAMDQYEDQYFSLLGDEEQAREYRAARKASRGRWVGGGYGIGGALKGAAFAGSMNAMSGAAHSVVNAIGNAITNYQTETKCIKLAKGYRNWFSQFLPGLLGQLVAFFVDFVNRQDEDIHLVTREEAVRSQEIDVSEMPAKDPEKRLHLGVAMLDTCPYVLGTYRFMLREFGDPTGTLEMFADAYDINLSPIKEEMLQEMFEQADTTTTACLDDYNEKSGYLSHTDQQLHDRLCAAYVNHKIDNHSNFSNRSINALADELLSFEKRYDYQAASERETLCWKVLAQNHIDPDRQDENDMVAAVQKIKELGKVIHLDFTPCITDLNGRIAIVVREKEEKRRQEEEERHRKEEEARQRDIEERTVPYVDTYDPETKEFTIGYKTLETHEEVEPFKELTEIIKNMLLELSYEMTPDQWEAKFSEIRATVENNGYPLRSDILQESYDRQDRERRTFEGKVYATVHDAKIAEDEVNSIRNLEQKVLEEKLLEYPKFSSRVWVSSQAEAEMQRLRQYIDDDISRRAKNDARLMKNGWIYGIITLVLLLIAVRWMAVGRIFLAIIAAIADVILFFLAKGNWDGAGWIQGHRREIEAYQAAVAGASEAGSSPNPNNVQEQAEPLCTACGKPLNGSYAFCPNCGAKIEQQNKPIT